MPNNIHKQKQQRQYIISTQLCVDITCMYWRCCLCLCRPILFVFYLAISVYNFNKRNLLTVRLLIANTVYTYAVHNNRAVTSIVLLS